MQARSHLVLPLVVAGALAFGSVAGAQTTDTAEDPPATQDTGNNTGVPVPPETVLSASGVSAQSTGTVALFFDGTYVDTNTDGTGEAYNLQQTLTTLGYTVNTFTGTTTAEWSAALTGVQAVLVPELEVDSTLGDDLDAGALDALRAFIAGGGRLIAFNARDVDFLSTVFGLPGTVVGDVEDCPCSITSSATGTEFAGGPASLDNLSDTDTVTLATLPAGSLNIYGDDDAPATEAGVAVTPDECGTVVYLGWDWFFGDGTPTGADEWFDVLDAAVSGSGSTCPVEAPIVVTFTG